MSGIEQLLEVMRALRDPKTGCPWDQEQDWHSLTKHTIEETYELLDAIQQEDTEEVRLELGDLLFHIVFYAKIAEESKLFDFNGVATGVAEKLTRRHPHVFGDVEKYADPEALNQAWEQIKQQERSEKAEGQPVSLLDGVTKALPALIRAEKIQRRAARVGFDWKSLPPVFEKLDEEVAEIHEALAQGDQKAIEHEIGDLLFTCVNLARHVKVDTEEALRGANHRFEQRFRMMESILGEDAKKAFSDMNDDELDALWQQAKKRLDNL